MLYIHIPYCHQKCSYCAFYSVARRTDFQRYADALCRELTERAQEWHRPVKTVYFGGGTPSVIPIAVLSQIVETIQSNYYVDGLEEATIEANPEDLTSEYLGQLRQIGFFNRISIGVQSFDDNALHLVNRVHDSRKAINAIASASAVGFDNISVDLMMGLPEQTTECFQSSLDKLAALPAFENVKHLSCYELTVEAGTILERQIRIGRVRLPEEEVVSAQYRALLEWCCANGFEQYEVSNFCRRGFHSKHNSRYWDRTPYIGVGAAAHSFDGSYRRWNVSDVDAYMDGALSGNVPFEKEVLTPCDAYNEYVMTALRTTKGVSKSVLSDLFPDFRHHFLHQVEPYLLNGLIYEDDESFRPTPAGLLHADGIAVSTMSSDFCHTADGAAATVNSGSCH